MKKLIVFSLLFFSLNGLYAVEMSTDAVELRALCEANGGVACAEFIERCARNELANVRRFRELREKGGPLESVYMGKGHVFIGYTSADSPIMSGIAWDCMNRQDCALRLLWLLQEAGYPSEAQRS